MATKQITDLTPTSIANDTDLAMIRQGVEDKNVPISAIRNIGNGIGDTAAIGSFGLGASAITIDSIFTDNDANLITKSGIYLIDETTLNAPFLGNGVLIHSDGINGSTAFQRGYSVDGDGEHIRSRDSSWGPWARTLHSDGNLEELEDTAAARTALDVYSKEEGDIRYIEHIDDRATQGEAEEGVVNNKYMTPLRTFQAIDKKFEADDTSYAGYTASRHYQRNVSLKFVDWLGSEVDAAIPQTVGPTGSGADLIVPALDELPEDCRYIDVDFQFLASVTSLSENVIFFIQTGQAGLSLNERISTQCANHIEVRFGSGPARTALYFNGKERIALDSNNTFYLNVSLAADVSESNISNKSFELFLRGFGV